MTSAYKYYTRLHSSRNNNKKNIWGSQRQALQMQTVKNLFREVEYRFIKMKNWFAKSKIDM